VQVSARSICLLNVCHDPFSRGSVDFGSAIGGVGKGGLILRADDIEDLVKMQGSPGV